MIFFKEIIDIKTKIRKKAVEAGLPEWKGGKIMNRGFRGAGCPGLGGR